MSILVEICYLVLNWSYSMITLFGPSPGHLTGKLVNSKSAGAKPNLAHYHGKLGIAQLECMVFLISNDIDRSTQSAQGGWHRLLPNAHPQGHAQTIDSRKRCHHGLGDETEPNKQHKKGTCDGRNIHLNSNTKIPMLCIDPLADRRKISWVNLYIMFYMMYHIDIALYPVWAIGQ